MCTLGCGTVKFLIPSSELIIQLVTKATDIFHSESPLLPQCCQSISMFVVQASCLHCIPELHWLNHAGNLGRLPSSSDVDA